MTDTFYALPLKLDDKRSPVCIAHSLRTCSKYFSSLVSLTRNFDSLGEQKCPPPPTKPPPQTRSLQINKLRDSGVQAFKIHKYADAVRLFTLGMDMALARPPWEPSALCRDEVVIFLANRAAARFMLNEYPEALADAEAVVELKRPWPKGHYWKGKALLAMGRVEDAKLSGELGLMYNANDNECNLLLKEVKKAQETQKAQL